MKIKPHADSAEQNPLIGQQRGFSDFVVYVDESGDHSLKSIDQDYPVFVLAFCIFYKGHYLSSVVPQLQQLKFDYLRSAWHQKPQTRPGYSWQIWLRDQLVGMCSNLIKQTKPSISCRRNFIVKVVGALLAKAMTSGD